MPGRGWLIVFEGIDGTGKSTQCQEMESYLKNIKIPVALFREPTDGIWGQKIRKILAVGRGDVTREEELSWFIKDRQEDVKKKIIYHLIHKLNMTNLLMIFAIIFILINKQNDICYIGQYNI